MSPKNASHPSGDSAAPKRGSGRRPAMTPARITALVLVALAIVLIVENTRQVRIRLLIPVVTMPLYLALLGMFVIGGLCGALLIRNRVKG
ncbi:LapA family protein [Streptomyces sp. NPDC091267]|uniref:LapA family protein n=1 Tax=Streptomyces sp. NPDC091267 TaxID=3155195 RepID=UPI0034493305